MDGCARELGLVFTVYEEMPYIGTRRSIIQVNCGQLLGLRNAQYILAVKMKTALPSPSMAPTTVKR